VQKQRTQSWAKTQVGNFYKSLPRINELARIGCIQSILRHLFRGKFFISPKRQTPALSVAGLDSMKQNMSNKTADKLKDFRQHIPT
jgi:hypothetical protein